MKITSRGDYIAALECQRQRFDIDELKWLYRDPAPESKAIRGYLRDLTYLQKAGIDEHLSDNLELRAFHRANVEHLDFEYQVELVQESGETGMRYSAEDFKRHAVAAVLLANDAELKRKALVKAKGRMVQCKYCGQELHASETERVKPRGSTRYERLCKPCAAKVKIAKIL